MIIIVVHYSITIYMYGCRNLLIDNQYPLAAAQAAVEE